MESSIFCLFCTLSVRFCSGVRGSFKGLYSWIPVEAAVLLEAIAATVYWNRTYANRHNSATYHFLALSQILSTREVKHRKTKTDRWMKFAANFPLLQFLGAFSKLRKATVSFVMSVCPSVRMEQLVFHWTDFYEILYLNISRHLSKNCKLYWNLTRITGTLHLR